jgi:hypothetical protein
MKWLIYTASMNAQWEFTWGCYFAILGVFIGVTHSLVPWRVRESIIFIAGSVLPILLVSLLSPYFGPQPAAVIVVLAIVNASCVFDRLKNEQRQTL